MRNGSPADDADRLRMAYSSERGVERLEEIHSLQWRDEFLVVERIFSPASDKLSVGLANIHSVVPDIEVNKDKILRATEIFKERRVNIAVFPELALTGYFWADEAECRRYMAQGMLETHYEWIEKELKPLLDDHLHEIILNGLTEAPNGRFYNTTVVIGKHNDYRDLSQSYRKVYLPGVEALYCEPGPENRLLAESPYGRFGFTTSYDYFFEKLLRDYAFEDEVDALFQTACWRAVAMRDYPSMNMRTDEYYGHLWDIVMPASSATNQVWTIACNAVGRHEISNASFWGGSGVWAPSGLPLVQASNIHEELLVLHNLDIKGQRRAEIDDFHYAFDFKEIYRPMTGSSHICRID